MQRGGSKGKIYRGNTHEVWLESTTLEMSHCVKNSFEKRGSSSQDTRRKGFMRGIKVPFGKGKIS